MCEIRNAVKKDPALRKAYEEMISGDSPDFQAFAKAMLDSPEEKIGPALDEAFKQHGPKPGTKRPIRGAVAEPKLGSPEDKRFFRLVAAVHAHPEYLGLCSQSPVGNDGTDARVKAIHATYHGNPIEGGPDAAVGLLPGTVTVTLPTDVALALVDLGQHVGGDEDGNGGNNPRRWLGVLAERIGTALPEGLRKLAPGAYWMVPQVGVIHSRRWNA
jgi:hypothetical protein